MPAAKMLNLKTQTSLEAENLFTDREEPRKAFWDLYNSMENGNYEVLAYYGVGGIGKTTLLKQIGKEMDEKIADGNRDHLFISFESKPEKENALYMISRQLMICNKGLECPLFDEAFRRMLEASGKSAEPYERKMKEFISDSPVLSRLVEFGNDLSPIPAVGTTIKTIESIVNFAQTKAKEKEMSEGENAYLYNEIKYSEAKELRKKLHLYLRKDIEEYMLNRSKPFVFLIDGYENFVDIRETGKEAMYLEEDEWLKNPDTGLSPIPNTIWVLAGREQPHWDPEILPAEHMHRIGDLAEADAISFFNKAGITDRELVKDLYRLTNGTPAYLDMCVKTYREVARERMPVIGDFGKNTSEFAKRYLENMNPDMRNMICILVGLPNVWEKELAREVAILAGKEHCIHTLDEILTMSIIERIDEGYKLHKTLREVIEKEHRASAWGGEVTIMSEAAQKVLDVLTDKIISSDDKDNRTEDLKKFVEILNKEETTISEEKLRQVSEVIKGEIKLTANYALCEEVLTSMVKFVYKQDFSANMKVHIQNHVVANLYRQGRYKECLELAESVYNFAITKLEVDDLDRIDSMDSLAMGYYACGDFYKAVELQEKCYELKKQKLGEANNETLSCLSHLSAYYSEIHNDEKALQLTEHCYEMRKKALGEEHPDTLINLSNLAICYSNVGDSKKALELSEMCYEMRKKVLGEEHPSTLLALSNLSNRYSGFDDEKALQFAQQCYDLRKKVLGEEHPETLSSLNNLANRFSDVGDNSRSLELAKQCYELRKRILGESHPLTVKTLNNISSMYCDIGDYTEALRLMQQCYEMRKMILGEENPETLKCLASLAVFNWKLGNKEKSIELTEQCYELRKRALGEENPATMQILYSLAYRYMEAGEYAKAQEYLNVHKEIKKRIAIKKHLGDNA